MRITVRTGPATVVLEISDEGPGIADALVGHVFDRGVSTADSTGIGLGLARAFIEADGGRLELVRARPPMFGVFLAVGRPMTAEDEEDLEDGDAEATGDPAAALSDASTDAGAQPIPQPTRAGSAGSVPDSS